MLSFAAALCMAIVFLAGRIAGAPGWRHQRELARAAACAFVYDLCCLANTEPLAVRPSVLLVQICVFEALLCLFFWSRYDRATFHREENAFDTWIERALVVVAVLTLVPGLSYSSAVWIRVDWAGASFGEGVPTIFGSAAYVLLLVAVARLFWRSVRAAREKQPGGLWNAWGLGVLIVAAALDIATNLRWISLPLTTNLGFIAPSLAAALDTTRRFVAEANTLDRLRTKLEADVEQRTRDLAQAQEKLRKEETLAALGRMAAGVAHEINNPSAVIAANLRYIQQALVGGNAVPEDAREAIADSLDGVRRITTIVRQMISSGRIARSASIGPVDVESIAARVVRTATSEARTIGREGVKTEIRVPAGCLVAANADLLEQVLLNLVQNGVQAFPRGSTGTVTISAAARGDRVLVVVEDDGPGIPDAVRERIFEPFFTTKSPGEGSGLGLSVSRGLVRSMDGDLRLASPGPGGTRFELDLPLATVVPTVAEEAPHAPDGGGGRVLVIDDEGAVRRSITRMLDGSYETLQASGVNEGLSRIVRDGPFEAVICDVLMPDGGGTRLYEELKEMQHPVLSRLLFLTGGTGEELAGAGVPILHKPTERGTLLDAIARLRRGRPEPGRSS
ncbi:MAG TPA: ATP-binding protein [bacterium]|nr:ATP-binding protein [bacterium]